MRNEVEVAADRDELARRVAARVATAVEEAIAETGWCNLALSGGSVMRWIYDELGLLQLRWDRVTFFFTDERGVGPRHPASNYAVAHDRLFNNPRIGLFQAHRIEAEDADHPRTAQRYAEQLPTTLLVAPDLEQALSGAEEVEQVALDVCLLALESDGAVCGWFPGPGLAALAAEERLVIAYQAPRKPVRRIALTPRAIEPCHDVFVVASGIERRAALAAVRALSEREREGPPELPSELLPEHAVWLVDKAALGLAPNQLL